MFARGGSNCPVQTLRTFFFRRIDPQDNFFFNNCSKGAISSPQMTDVWYLANPCKQFQFCKFMPHIFKNSGCSRKYTTHCLCSTATQASNNERFEIRYIIYMSGYRNEASVRSFNRDCSTAQKQHLSHAFAKVAKASSSAESLPCIVASPCTFRITTAPPHQAHVEPTVSPSRLSPSFISNYNNCTFRLGYNKLNSVS